MLSWLFLFRFEKLVPDYWIEPLLQGHEHSIACIRARDSERMSPRDQIGYMFRSNVLPPYGL